ncbi:hypothetical protein [Lentzea cavernae]|uniref:DUF2470 domain-containing protein n=1 Tax=Lentzea cavernae TaxID=2020703 RepID=A0ABQ3MVW1_9PSEU|nr:hypothetical protein [Lentzea cavernae]GHH62328.1 hypothetical protein GCM10017774_89890 [Lentzea cavernae]
MIEPANYDIAVSFAEDQRAVADEVVEACRQRGLTVLESNDLPQAQVRFLVPFASTADELPTGDDHVLPVLTGEAPWSPDYLRADEHLVDTLVARVETAETSQQPRIPVADAVAALKQPAPTPFSGHAEQNAALRHLAEQFAAASPALARRGLAGTMHQGDTTIAVRVERAEDKVYALEVRRDGTSDDIVNFVVLGGPAEFSTLWQRIEDMLTTL